MASADPKSSTRSKALEAAVFFADKDKMVPLVTNAIKSDSSYTVQSNAISLLIELGSRIEAFKEASSVLDDLKLTKDVKVKVMVSEALSQSGNPEHFEFIKQVAEEKLSGSEALRAFISFVVFVAMAEEQDDHYAWMESLVAITEQKALNPQGQVKMYFSRIVEYEQGVISSKIEQLNTRIAEQASAAQSLEQLKLKYENLSDRLNQIPTE